MVAGLAYYMALKYQPDRVALLKPLYEEEFQRAASEDVEKASYSMVPRQQLDYVMGKFATGKFAQRISDQRWNGLSL